MKKFFKEHEGIIQWFVFVVMSMIFLLKLFTDGLVYTFIVMIPAFIFLFPPLSRVIIKKTRLKKVAFYGLALIVISFCWTISNVILESHKAEQQRINQEKKQKEIDQKAKEEEEKKRQDEEKKNIPSGNEKKLTTESLTGDQNTVNVQQENE